MRLVSLQSMTLAALAAAGLTQALSIDPKAYAGWSDSGPGKIMHVVLFELKASLNETVKKGVRQ